MYKDARRIIHQTVAALYPLLGTSVETTTHSILIHMKKKPVQKKHSGTSSTLSSSLSTNSTTTTSTTTSTLPVAPPSVQISVADVYLPWDNKEGMNQALVWQKCIKVGDHVEILGVGGRSSTGQPTYFVFGLSIIGYDKCVHGRIEV